MTLANPKPPMRRRFLLWAASLVCLGFLVGCGARPDPVQAEATSETRPDTPSAAVHPAKPNVIVFLSDTLGARHLGCYGYDRPTSPTIDALAEQGFLFERCYAQCSWTRPSVASMLTGVQASVHQATVSRRDNNQAYYEAQVLRDAFLTMGEAFLAGGYHTAIFQSNTHLQEEYGFMQGFEKRHFGRFIDPKPQMDLVLDWLDKDVQEPFFLYVHAIDPHHPYNPPQESFQTLFGDVAAPSERDMKIVRRYHGVYEAWVHGQQPFEGVKLSELSPEGLDFLRMRYDAEIRHVDDQLKRLLDKVDELGCRSRTTIAFVSDHGEEFREHGGIGHGRSLFDEVLHVPLIICPPGATTHVRVERAVSMFDLYPSLLTLAGLPIPEGLQAKSLFSASGECTATANEAVASELARRPLYSVIVEPYKVILDVDTKEFTIYDREKDPGETKPVADLAPDKRQALIDALLNQMKRNEDLAAVYGPPEWVRQDEESVEQLRAMGYL